MKGRSSEIEHEMLIRQEFAIKAMAVGLRDFYLLYEVQTGSGAHPASYPMGTRSSIPGGKRPGHEANHSPPSSTEVKNSGDIRVPLLPHTSSRRGA
jgi:hypothetical protein